MSFLCPGCKTATLESARLEEGLPTERCTTCEGQWVTSVRYFGFVAGINGDSMGGAMPESRADSPALKICPTCLKFMHYYPVGCGLPFGIDKCNTCGGVWLHAGEWEALRAAGFVRQLHAISSDTWQHEVERQERHQAQITAMTRRIGKPDFQELARIAAWLRDHPHRDEMLAYLRHHAGDAPAEAYPDRDHRHHDPDGPRSSVFGRRYRME